MDVSTASDELYASLKANENVNGSGVTRKDGKDVIVIYLKKENRKISKEIPTTYQGFDVQTSVIGNMTFFNG